MEESPGIMSFVKLNPVSRRFCFGLAAVFCAVLSLCCPAGAEEFGELPPLPRGPLLLTSAKLEQLSADYWLRRMPDAGKLLKTPAQLKSFNDDIHAMIKDCRDIFKMDLQRRGKPVQDQLELEYRALSGRVLYTVDGKRIRKEVFTEDVRPVMQVEKVPERIKVKWGVAVRQASIRALPSEVRMLEKVGDIEFDQLQFTQIKLWTPVGIYHTSKDGKWLYVQAPYSRGWIRAKDIAVFSSRDEIQKKIKAGRFLVVTGESISIYSDEKFGKRYQKPSMGTLVPLRRKTASAYEVWAPARRSDGSVLLKKTYIPLTADVSEGFLPYTRRNIVRQAFKLLGARYGWGGTYNGRDCSGFTHDIFLTLGVDMPRDSKGQGFIGTQMDHFEYKEDTERKLAALRASTPGLTLLRMPKHQMLYLGEVNGQFYVIHCTWAERISMTSDDKRRINQVVVSDLSLNGKSRMSSLFNRIISISEIN